MHCQYNESVHQKEQHTSGINTTFETLKWEYTFATDVLIAIRDESPLVCRAPDVSERHIGTSMIRDCTTALFLVTMYRQFARKVGTSANSALMRYYLLRLKLSNLNRDCEVNESMLKKYKKIVNLNNYI